MNRPRQRPLFLAAAAFLVADSLGCILLLATPELLAPIVASASDEDLFASLAALYSFIAGTGVGLAYLFPRQAYSLLTEEHSAGRLVASGPTATYWHRPGRWVAVGLLGLACWGVYIGLLPCLVADGSPVVLAWAGGRTIAYAIILLAAVRALRIARRAERAA
jgi:hypothetical protein